MNQSNEQIYKAYKFKQGIGQTELDTERTFAVKVVSTGTSARAVNLAKPPSMIKHELNMLKWFNDLEANKSVDENSVVKLFNGETVEDKSPMVVEHEKLLPLHVGLRRDFSMIYVMEFGDNTLDNYLKQWDELATAKQMGEQQIKQDAEQLLAKLASTLSTFHRHAAHLHLKPGNWIFVRGENKWKLIDLQSAIPNFEQYKPLQMGKEERFPEDFVEFACNSLNNEIYLTKFIAPANERPSTYASPEHSTACQRTRPMLSKWRHPFRKRIGQDQLTEMSAQLMQIGTKSDVWSFGVLMLEILAHTPQVNPADQRADALRIFVKIRAEFVSRIVAKDRMGMRQRIEEFAHFKGRRKKVRMDGQKLDTKLGKYMERIQRHFPAAFRALLKIFEKDKNKRAEMSEIVDILSAKI
ncbi:hypothetical protein niasHT_007099 [Heterodera trifolii]|uniref:Protein kinase domain-containing protein n=1 Tax=Heterodera trifolii TaxID=157864 RepID=A0ABD2LXL8_9BILA